MATRQTVMVKPEPVVEWWDQQREHPMDDAAFVQAFCEWILLNTTDHSLRSVRNRSYRFIRNFMAPELDKELARYREVHP